MPRRSGRTAARHDEKHCLSAVPLSALDGAYRAVLQGTEERGRLEAEMEELGGLPAYQRACDTAFP